eukprot:5301638-Amphidinium_carterae.1
MGLLSRLAETARPQLESCIGFVSTPLGFIGTREELVLSGMLRSSSCVAAFSAVDRKHFWTEELGGLIYVDCLCQIELDIKIQNP